MDEVLKFIGNRTVFFVASVDGDKPRVRPFGLAIPYQGKIYFTTGNEKDVYKQLIANPNVEICAMGLDNQWIRVSGKAVFEDNMVIKNAAFAEYPELKNIYSSPDDPKLTTFYLADGEATIFSMLAPPRKFKI